jgi:glucosylceramidase
MKRSKIQILALRLLQRIRSSSGTLGVSRFTEISSLVLRRTAVSCAMLVFVAFAQDSKTEREHPRADQQGTLRIDVFESSEASHESLQKKAPIQFAKERSATLTITVDDSVKYQEIDGFGASLSESSAWLLKRKLTDPQRREALLMLFDRKRGIGLSMLRQPMGASDFALSEYSYDDVPVGETDPELKKFSLDHDRVDILPVLKEILAINPKIKIIGSPWSAPGWMKTSSSMTQGALLPSAYDAYARYFVKYVQEYEAAGVPIFAITMQNEPLHVPHDYPGLGMMATEQTAFLRDHLGPAFQKAGLRTKILVFDHNWDLVQYPISILNDANAAKFAAGTATHCYGGSVTAQNELHQRFSDKDIWMTECSGGEWQKGKLLQQQLHLIIGVTRHWGKSVIFWNLALNQNHEPYLGGCTTCRGVMTVDESSSPAQVKPTVDYTALGHASKFLLPGARRIESNTFGQGSLEDVAFQNPDGSVVVVVLNGSDSPISFNLSWRGRFAQYKLAGAEAATFVWGGHSEQ